TQTLMGVKRVIAVPFFLENEVVGNLFVMTRRTAFTSWETTILTAFGQQAAVGIRNARYYREAQEQRQIATMFARMAFSATTSVHALRNHIGAAHTHLNLFAMMADSSPDQAARLLARTPAIVGRLDKAADLLDKLHEPWRQEPDRSVSVNDCVIRALRDVFPEVRTKLGKEQVVKVSGIAIHLALTSPEPMIVTSADMLAEAFRIVLKNGAEALLESKNERKLWLRTSWSGRDQLQVFIQDSGTGIKETHLTKIFDMGWSTKEGQGMGFGLFWTKDYVNGMGGEIRVESVWQQGTSFCIELPVMQASA
ncbi:MAG: GAF domain-containing sensor histidine kinase, partial [Symploca sp. SIO1C4]|nr:GAF domain-containing sensor histidine kinase [Symploca sp. SIO1C4]